MFATSVPAWPRPTTSECRIWKAVDTGRPFSRAALGSARLTLLRRHGQQASASTDSRSAATPLGTSGTTATRRPCRVERPRRGSARRVESPPREGERYAMAVSRSLCISSGRTRVAEPAGISGGPPRSSRPLPSTQTARRWSRDSASKCGVTTRSRRSRQPLRPSMKPCWRPTVG